jgi:hypothetical protein
LTTPASRATRESTGIIGQDAANQVVDRPEIEAFVGA